MKQKVLIIDDNPVIVKMTVSLLSSAGYDVLQANDGLKGLELAQEGQPDVILLDIILPQMHGFEICRKLKDCDTTRNIPVIFITATGLEEVVNNEPDLQVAGCINKPFGLKELQAAITKALG